MTKEQNMKQIERNDEELYYSEDDDEFFFMMRIRK